MRLIDADELKKAFDFDDDVELECAVVQFGIDNAPTVDPVTHGHWIMDLRKSGFAYTCSCCGVTGKMARTTYSYCPWCGASMDEVTE